MGKKFRHDDYKQAKANAVLAKYKKGFTLPGYNYLGPFNGIHNGPPTSKSDAAAQIHDHEYSASIKNHGSITTYLRHNDADERFIKRIKHDKDYGARIAQSVFNFKKKANERLGFTTPLRIKRITDLMISPANVKRPRLSFANLPPNNELPMPIASPDGDGSGNNGGLKETPIDDVMDVHRGPPDYTFASLPFIESMYLTSTTTQRDHTFRMTSPYDPRISLSAATDVNTSTGSTLITSPLAEASDPMVAADQARWYNLYAGMYDYYHVVSAKWKMTIENLSGEMLWVHQMYHNAESPPDGSNEDMLLWQDCSSQLLGPHYVAVTTAGIEVSEQTQSTNPQTEGSTPAAATLTNYETGNHVQRKGGPSPCAVFTGQYSPGDYTRAIHLDTMVENWTSTAANPLLAERLTFRFKPYGPSYFTNSASSSDRPLVFRYILQIDYLVEFKQLKTGLRYPVQRQPLTVQIGNDSSATN